MQNQQFQSFFYKDTSIKQRILKARSLSPKNTNKKTFKTANYQNPDYENFTLNYTSQKVYKDEQYEISVNNSKQPFLPQNKLQLISKKGTIKQYFDKQQQKEQGLDNYNQNYQKQNWDNGQQVLRQVRKPLKLGNQSNLLSSYRVNSSPMRSRSPGQIVVSPGQVKEFNRLNINQFQSYEQFTQPIFYHGNNQKNIERQDDFILKNNSQNFNQIDNNQNQPFFADVIEKQKQQIKELKNSLKNQNTISNNTKVTLDHFYQLLKEQIMEDEKIQDELNKNDPYKIILTQDKTRYKLSLMQKLLELIFKEQKILSPYLQTISEQIQNLIICSQEGIYDILSKFTNSNIEPGQKRASYKELVIAYIRGIQSWEEKLEQQFDINSEKYKEFPKFQCKELIGKVVTATDVIRNETEKRDTVKLKIQIKQKDTTIQALQKQLTELNQVHQDKMNEKLKEKDNENLDIRDKMNQLRREFDNLEKEKQDVEKQLEQNNQQQKFIEERLQELESENQQMQENLTYYVNKENNNQNQEDKVVFLNNNNNNNNSSNNQNNQNQNRRQSNIDPQKQVINSIQRKSSNTGQQILKKGQKNQIPMDKLKRQGSKLVQF